MLGNAVRFSFVGAVALVIVGCSGVSTEEFEAERASRIDAEEQVVTATNQRDQAIEATNMALDRADREIDLRATAEAELRQVQAQLRSEENARQQAERNVNREAELLSSTEVRLEHAETQRDVSEKRAAFELARTNPTIKMIATAELAFNIEPLPWYAAEGTQDAVADIVNSLESWRPNGVRIREAKGEELADIYVRWVRDYGDHLLGLAIHQTVLHVGLGSTNCAGEWQAFDANSVKKILWHEFGHAFGYGHSEDPNNVMYPTTRTRYLVDHEVSGKLLAARWYQTFWLCNGGQVNLSFYVHDDAVGDLTFSILPPGLSAAAYVDDERGHNRDCGRRARQRLNITCVVEAGSLLLVHNDNPSDDIVFSGQIIRLDDPPWPNMQWDEDAFYYDEETLDYYRKLFAE